LAPTLFRRAGSTALTDRRGECVYAGCPHYRKCFIERSARASAAADSVIANHALVMVNAARGRELGSRPNRIVFDEGHHLFDAADSTFGAVLSGSETIELRRWLIGPEGKSRGRRRGLAARLMDVASYDEAGGLALEAAIAAAGALPGEGWLARIGEGAPFGPLEKLLAAVRGAVYARASAQDAGYGLETEVAELDPAWWMPPRRRWKPGAAAPPAGRARQAARSGAGGCAGLARPAGAGSCRRRDRGAHVARADPRRLDRPARPARRTGDPDFVDWLAIERVDGREYDIGIHRRWLDPTRPLADAVLKPAHGVLVTSATLRGSEDWSAAEARTGACHLDQPAQRFAAESPFDYAGRSEGAGRHRREARRRARRWRAPMRA
jgi:ATP-dependent DNA helicase DinG